MKYTLGKDWKRSIYKTLKAGQTLDITPELGQWLDDNGYGEFEYGTNSGYALCTKNLNEFG